MPTILRFRGFRIVIYAADHDPAHVHCIKGNSLLVLLLHCRRGPVTIRNTYKMSRNDESALIQFVGANLELLCEAWENIRDQRQGTQTS